MVEIKTERLKLRYVKAEDWSSIREIWVEFNKSQYAGFDCYHSTDGEYVKSQIEKWALASLYTVEHKFFAVCLGEQVIGFFSMNLDGQAYDIGYGFHPDYMGKGYARESLTALVNYCHECGVNYFTAGTALLNTPSIKLLNACGFKKIGEEKVSFFKDADGNPIYFDGGNFELRF